MRVGIPREIACGERRVAAASDGVGRLVRAGVDVLVESKAGEGASVLDAAYRDAGARVLPDAADVYGQGQIVLKVVRPLHNEALGTHEAELMAPGTVVVSFYVIGKVPKCLHTPLMSTTSSTPPRAPTRTTSSIWTGPGCCLAMRGRG